jgi:NADH:ubiquinone oxidoreductase subunit E
MKTMEGAKQSATLVPASGYFGPEASAPGEVMDAEVKSLIDGYVETHPGSRERLIPLLHLAQAKLGYLPPVVQEYVAHVLGMSPVQVAGVISFYHFFTTTPRGRYQIKVCTGTACFVRGAMNLVGELSKVLGISLGEVSEDGLFSLEQVRCIGACGLAPAMMVNNDVYGHLSRKDVKRVVRQLRKGANVEESPTGEMAEGDGVH